MSAKRLPLLIAAVLVAMSSLAGTSVATSNLFFEAPEYPTNPGPTAVVTGDFNHDGKLDLAVVNGCAPGCIGGLGTVSIQFGRGDGTFHIHVDYRIGEIPQSIAAADLNGDGNLDLVVANRADTGARVHRDGEVTADQQQDDV